MTQPRNMKRVGGLYIGRSRPLAWSKTLWCVVARVGMVCVSKKATIVSWLVSSASNAPSPTNTTSIATPSWGVTGLRAGGVRAPGASFISPGGRTPEGNMDIVACADRA